MLGHLPHEILRESFMFLKHDGTITGKVTEWRRYCHLRGGMEVPGELAFTGRRKHIRKLKRYSQFHML